MIIYKKLIIKTGKENRNVIIGEADNDEERLEMFALRYKVYSEKGYIDEKLYSKKIEIDDYDYLKTTRHFIVLLDDGNNKKIIGSLRVISTKPLPTESIFTFEAPKVMNSIPSENKFEIGRLIIIPPDKAKKDFLPRGLVLLILMNVLGEYGIKNNYIGGYSFIKKSLESKLKKVGYPIGYIDNYSYFYPQNGVLYKYFNQTLDPVIPIFFLTKKIFDFTEKIINNRIFFKIEPNGNLIYKNNFFTYVLRIIKIV